MSSFVEGAGMRRLPPIRYLRRSYADEGAVPASAVGEAITRYQIKADKINPL